MANFKSYTIDNKEYIRVSRILNCLPKPWLENYVKSRAKESFWDMVNTRVVNSKWPLNPMCQTHTGKRDLTCPDCLSEFEEKIVPEIDIEDIKFCLDASNRHSKEAMEQGSLVHSCIEVWEKLWDSYDTTYMDLLREYYPELSESFIAYYQCLGEYGMNVLESEQTVHYDGDISYAGTMDLLVEMDGELWIGDIKTFESEVSWKAFKKCPRCEGREVVLEDIWGLCPDCKGTGKKGKRASKVSDSKEKLITELNNPLEYVIEEVVEPPMIKKEHLIQCEAYRRAYNQQNPIELTQGEAFKELATYGQQIMTMEGMEETYYYSIEDKIKNRFILYLDRRDKSNYYLHKIPVSENEGHWSLFQSAYNIFKNF